MSALDRLTIRGFKSIEALEGFVFRKGLNVFIGANGAGKTNLISFFRMMGSIVEGNFNKYVKRNGKVKDLLFNGRRVRQEMYFEMHFGGGSYKFKVKPTHKSMRNIEKDVPCCITEESIRSPSGDKYRNSGSCHDTSLFVRKAKNTEGAQDIIQFMYNAISSWQVYHFHGTSKTAGMQQYATARDSGVLGGDGANIAPFLYALKSQRELWYKEILNTIRIVMPFFNKFQFETRKYGDVDKPNLTWYQKGLDSPMQPHLLPDEAIRFICLAAALLQPNPPSTIIIDEPELGLHPTVIPILAELIQDAAKRAQVIVAVQSPILIDRFKAKNIVVVNHETGASTFTRLEEKELTYWLENYSIGEIWNKNVTSKRNCVLMNAWK